MKWLFRLMTFAILAVAIGLPFFMENKQGKPMLSLPSAKDFLPKDNAGATAILPSTTTQVFKWQDDQGVWHYGDQAPAAAQNIQTVSVDSRTNVIQGMKKEEQTNSDPAKLAAEKMTPPDSGVLTLDRAMNVMNDAKLAAQSMEARNAQLQQIVGESE